MERYAMFLEWQNQLCQVTMLPKTIYSLNAVLIKWGTVCFIELEEKKILYGATKTLYSQTILIKENKIARIRLPDLRLYYRATVIKTVWYWPQNRITDQWNGTESPEIIPCTCGQLHSSQILTSLHSLCHCFSSGQIICLDYCSQKQLLASGLVSLHCLSPNCIVCSFIYYYFLKILIYFLYLVGLDPLCGLWDLIP